MHAAVALDQRVAADRATLGQSTGHCCARRWRVFPTDDAEFEELNYARRRPWPCVVHPMNSEPSDKQLPRLIAPLTQSSAIGSWPALANGSSDLVDWGSPPNCSSGQLPPERTWSSSHRRSVARPP